MFSNLEMQIKLSNGELKLLAAELLLHEAREDQHAGPLLEEKYKSSANLGP